MYNLGPIFQTERLLFRKVVRQDSCYLAKLAEENVSSMQEIGLPVMPLHAYWDWVAGLEQKTRSPEHENFFCLAAFNKATKTTVGVCTITEQPSPPHYLEIGAVVDKGLRGNGFGAEMVFGLTSFCFNLLHMQEIKARTQKNNYAAIRMLELNGFTPTDQESHIEFSMNSRRWDVIIEDGLTRQTQHPVPMAA